MTTIVNTPSGDRQFRRERFSNRNRAPDRICRVTRIFRPSGTPADGSGTGKRAGAPSERSGKDRCKREPGEIAGGFIIRNQMLTL